MEKRDLYDKDRNKLGMIIHKGDEIPNGCYIMVVMILMQNSKGEFLIQKRSELKGGKWAFTGGHPKAGESSLEGIISEVREELGIDISSQKIKLMKSLKEQLKHSKNPLEQLALKSDIARLDQEITYLKNHIMK